MIFTVGNIKGGIGKSTLACNLAVFLSKLEGETSTCLIDADKQQSSANFARMRNHQKSTGAVKDGCFDHINSIGKDIVNQLDTAKKKYNNVVIDVGGQDNYALRAALLESDRLLVPVAPRSFDFWSMKLIADVVEEAKTINPNLQIHSVLNMGYPQGSDNRETLKAVKEQYPILQMLSCVIVYRKHWATSSGFGYSVMDKKFRDSKALYEFWRLLSGVGFTNEQILKGLC